MKLMERQVQGWGWATGGVERSRVKEGGELGCGWWRRAVCRAKAG
jgi:hypothetical protein